MSAPPVPTLSIPRLPELDLSSGSFARRTITGTHLHTLQGCAHEVVLDFRLSREEKLAPVEAVQRLLARGRAFEDEVVRELAWVEPEYERGDFETGAAETLRLMREGHPLIYQAVLYRLPYLGIADLLRRVETPSALGAHAYEVIDIKSSRKAKLEQILQVAFYSLLLGEAQGVVPSHGALWLRDAPEERFLVEDYVWTLLDQLDELTALLSGRAVSRPHRTSRCDGCGWRARCLPEMESADDLSLLPAISRSRAARLRSHGIASVAALAAANPEELLLRRVLPPASARTLRAQARARSASSCLKLEPEGPDLRGALLFWSAEPDPFRIDRLWLVRAAVLEGGRVTSLLRRLLRDDGDESRALEELLAWIAAHPCAGALHFGERNAAALAGAFARHPAGSQALPPFLASSRDLRSLWLAHLAHPVPNATLYDLGRWYGVRALEEGGVTPALWWENARADGEDRWRERVERADDEDLSTVSRLIAELGSASTASAEPLPSLQVPAVLGRG